MDPITLAMGLAQFAPQIIKWVTGSPKAEEAAKQVVDIAQVVTGRAGNEALEALQVDPKLAMDFRKAVMGVEADLDKAYWCKICLFLCDRRRRFWGWRKNWWN